MTQWLPVNILSHEVADRMIASFVEVFPHALLFVGAGDQLILLGGREPFDPAVLERRFAESRGARRDLASIGLREPLAILARIGRVDDALRADVAGVRGISDERNDLALTITDPFDPPVLAFDPQGVLEALDPSRLDCGHWLIATLDDPERLREVVPDYPATVERARP